jgi:hypothetical protein
MIINKEEIEKAAENYCNIQNIHPSDIALSKEVFMAGALIVESKVQEHVGDIIIENQGLKLYKDNEAKRFKELAVEFARYIRSNPKEVKDYSLTIFEEGKFVSDDVKHYDNIEELFETFIKERNEKN